ncbi:MAG: DJ-1/PfpI family protein [Casimicrobiaceae bacterium]
MRAAVLIYEGVEPIDLATCGVLSMARRVVPSISMATVAERAGSVRLANGLTVLADHGYADAPPVDVLIITGGPGWQAAAKSVAMLDFIRATSAHAVVAAVCTGGMILAASGLLDGRSATTKCQVIGAEDSPLRLMRERHPAINVIDARLVDCDRVLTGGGVTLCIDMMLHLVERFHGAEAARETARIMEYSTARAANEARSPTVKSGH